MKKYRNAIILIPLIILGFLFQPVFSQDRMQDRKESSLDKKHHKIVGLLQDAYVIIDKYPEVTYSYVYEDGTLSEVKIEGLTNMSDRAKLETCLMDMEHLKKEIVNQTDYSGVYYVSEKEPEPKAGYRDFYRELQTNLDYPANAKKNGVEGTVFVKFIVEDDGRVRNVTATENIDTPFAVAEQNMIEEAEQAVLATSGQWKPATVGGLAVDQWVYLPVRFNLEESSHPLY